TASLRGGAPAPLCGAADRAAVASRAAAGPDAAAPARAIRLVGRATPAAAGEDRYPGVQELRWQCDLSQDRGGAQPRPAGDYDRAPRQAGRHDRDDCAQSGTVARSLRHSAFAAWRVDPAADAARRAGANDGERAHVGAAWVGGAEGRG